MYYSLNYIAFSNFRIKMSEYFTAVEKKAKRSG